MPADLALMRVCDCQSFSFLFFNALKIFALVFIRLCGRRYRLRLCLCACASLKIFEKITW